MKIHSEILIDFFSRNIYELLLYLKNILSKETESFYLLYQHLYDLFRFLELKLTVLIFIDFRYLFDWWNIILDVSINSFVVHQKVQNYFLIICLLLIESIKLKLRLQNFLLVLQFSLFCKIQEITFFWELKLCYLLFYFNQLIVLRLILFYFGVRFL